MRESESRILSIKAFSTRGVERVGGVTLMKKRTRVALIGVVWLVFLPSLVLIPLVWPGIVQSVSQGQASIAGVVKDTSGAVLPGVTVEATSPALIERTQIVVTDGTGQYRIEKLRPGVYTITFTRVGFATVKREGIELNGTFMASVNAELLGVKTR